MFHVSHIILHVFRAAKISFAEYTAILGLPAMITGIVSFAILYIIYRKPLTKMSTTSTEVLTKADTAETMQPTPTQSSSIPSKRSAIFGTVIFLLGLVFLVSASFADIELWIVTSVVCAVMLVKDLSIDIFPSFWKFERIAVNNDRDINLEEIKKNTGNTDEPVNIENAAVAKSQTISEPQQRRIAWQITTRMPWKIVPCILSMFILVAAMDSTGWIPRIANLFRGAVSGTGPILSAISVTYLSTLICALVNNQPMTILLTRVLFHPNFACHVSRTEWIASIFGLIMGSNFGANITLNGALAGIMWESILESYGVKSVGYVYFMKTGSLVMLPTIIAAASVTGLEIFSGWYKIDTV